MLQNYIPRHLEGVALNIAGQYPALLVTGSRQVGKTTLLKKLFPELKLEALDDPSIQLMVRDDAKSFFESLKTPVILDEAQSAPELFPLIRAAADRQNQPGRFFLTGSQQFLLMQHVTESLAGRIAILNLMGLSLRELAGSSCRAAFIPTEAFLREREQGINENDQLRQSTVWDLIWRGMCPRLHNGAPIDTERYYSDYVNTYLERDVSALAQIGDRTKFFKFMRLIAGMTGCLLNKSDLANAVDISVSTVDRWISVLEASAIIFILHPYHSNLKRRLTKTPKLYFLDTGLAAWLVGWSSAEVLERSPMAGAFFETFVICEIIKSHVNEKGLFPRNLSFYRDGSKREIDLLIERDGVLYPIEIKRASVARPSDLSAFALLKDIPNVQLGSGAVICLTDRLKAIGDNNWALPPWMI